MVRYNIRVRFRVRVRYRGRVRYIKPGLRQGFGVKLGFEIGLRKALRLGSSFFRKYFGLRFNQKMGQTRGICTHKFV